MKKPHMQTALFGLAIAVVCGWILLEPWWQQRASRKPVAHSPEVVTPLLQETFARWVAQGDKQRALPSSLQADVKGAMRVNAEGNLLVDPLLRQAFEHFLTALADHSRAQVRARVARYLHQQLPPMAAVQAWDVFNRYLHYRDVVAGLPPPDDGSERQHDDLERQQRLRDVLLGAKLADAFFQGEELYVRVVPAASAPPPVVTPVRAKERHGDVLGLDTRDP